MVSEIPGLFVAVTSYRSSGIKTSHDMQIDVPNIAQRGILNIIDLCEEVRIFDVMIN